MVFTGSFQQPSLYTFFTGKPSIVISSLATRQTQFDLWHFEDAWADSPVLIYGSYKGKSEKFRVGSDEFEGFFASRLQTTNRLRIEFDVHEKNMAPGDSIRIKFTIENPTGSDVHFEDDYFQIEMKAMVHNKKAHKELEGMLTQKIYLLKAKDKYRVKSNSRCRFFPLANMGWRCAAVPYLVQP